MKTLFLFLFSISLLRFALTAFSAPQSPSGFSSGRLSSVSRNKISMALKSDDLTRSKESQECPLRTFRVKADNDGLSTATFALG
jgi:hypothetical protein